MTTEELRSEFWQFVCDITLHLGVNGLGADYVALVVALRQSGWGTMPSPAILGKAN